MATKREIGNNGAEKSTKVRAPRGNPAWVAGGPSPNPSGRPRKLVEIEAMLDAEHRTVANLRKVFAELRRIAMGTKKGIYWQGDLVATEVQYDAAFMKLYLDRVLGPVKELLTEDELRDAPDAVIEWLRRAS